MTPPYSNAIVENAESLPGIAGYKDDISNGYLKAAFDAKQAGMLKSALEKLLDRPEAKEVLHADEPSIAAIPGTVYIELK